MEIKRSFLSRWLGAKPEEAAEAEPLPDQPQAEEAPPEEKPRHRLELPQSHTIHKLWSIYNEQTGSWQPMPELALEGPSDPLLPDKEAAMELVRLQMAVNAAVNGRFELLRDQWDQKEGEVKKPLDLPDLDALVTVFLSKEERAAWVLVYPPVGRGRELDRAALDQALSEHEVSYGVDQSALEELAQSPNRYFRLVPVATGKEPVPGTDGRIEDLFPRSQERKLAVDEHGRVDYASVDFIHNVEEGGVICRIIPPTDGTPGRTVRDQEVPAKDGKPATVPKGRNTVLSEDGQTLVASISGHVEFSGRSFQVKPVLDIPGNVDFSVGNINFLGDVKIRGDVCAGFTVRATGNITVGGVVEACTVEAGRDLIVSGGVKGEERSVIRAQRSIFAKFLENCCAYARVNLEAECVINCEVYCDGAVTVRSGYRSIIGGKIHSAHEVSAGVIGSRTGKHTEIVLGGFPCEEFDDDLLKREVQELEETLARTERQPDSPSRTSQIGKLRMQLVLSQGRLKELEAEKQQQALEPQDPGLRRMECDTVYPGTILTIDHLVHRFDDKFVKCTAMMVDGEIHFM